MARAVTRASRAGYQMVKRALATPHRMTVGDLRAALHGLPDAAGVTVNGATRCFDLTGAEQLESWDGPLYLSLDVLTEGDPEEELGAGKALEVEIAELHARLTETLDALAQLLPKPRKIKKGRR